MLLTPWRSLGFLFGLVLIFGVSGRRRVTSEDGLLNALDLELAWIAFPIFSPRFLVQHAWVDL
jgi:hypothetical protein